MARRPLAGLLPQYAKNAGGAAAANYWLKLYQPNSTNANIVMYTLQEGGATLEKCKLNSRGETISNVNDDDSTFIPYVENDYDAYLFFTESDADANNTNNAVFLGQNIQGELVQEGDLPQYIAAEFSVVEDFENGGSPITTANGLSIDSSNVDDYLGRLLNTTYYDLGSKEGGGTYILITSSEYGATPDGYIDHYFFNANYVAALKSDGAVNTSKTGGSEDGLLALLGSDSVSKIILDSDIELTQDLVIDKDLAVVKGTINGPHTLTISSYIEAPRRQIFGGTVEVVTADGYGNNLCYPEWFKDDADPDYTSALQKAGDFLIPTGGHVSCANGKNYSYTDGIFFSLQTKSITLGGSSSRETSILTQTGVGVGMYFRSDGDLFVNGRVVYAECIGLNADAGNENAVGFRFSDGWGHGCIGLTIREWLNSKAIQFYNYNRFTEGWILKDVVIRRPLISVDFERDPDTPRANTDSFAHGIVDNVNISVGNGGLGYGPTSAFDISTENKGGASTGEAGANVYNITIESLILFSEVSGNVRFFNVRFPGNILTGHANIAIDGFIGQTSADHQVLYQRDDGYINLQGRFIHQQGATVRPDDQWRALCFTEQNNALVDRRSPCNYIGGIVRAGGTVDIGTDGSKTIRLNAASQYRVKISGKGDGTFINGEYHVITYDANLIANVDLVSGYASPNVNITTRDNLAGHSFSENDGCLIDVVLDNSAPGPEEIVYYIDIEQIEG